MLLALFLALAAQAPAPGSIEGTWQSPAANLVIVIAPCGNRLCGTVAWASDKAKKDSAKAAPQLVGTQLLTGLQPDRNGRWHGKLFIPDRNMRVTAKIERAGDAQLKVSGCAFGRSLCKSQLWSRVDGPLPGAG